MFIRMSDCIFDDENEKIQECYQVLLSLKQFQIAVLKGRKSTQQSIFNKHDFLWMGQKGKPNWQKAGTD